MHQTWDKLLFLHWPVPLEQIRPLIPPRLTIDTFNETAWIAVTPLVVSRLRPTLLPPVPWLSHSLEINVRTYVHLDGVPGVWFFSLDASNPLAVIGARAGFSLPYLRATIRKRCSGNTLEFRSGRTHYNAVPARLACEWTTGGALPDPLPDSCDFFLIERYCLYTAQEDRLYRVRIHHRHWPLCAANVSRLESTMIEALGIPTPARQPLVHAQRAMLRVKVWRARQV